ncbi:MAG: sensor histidine kinase [Microbacteriaceae bacterium]|jgi:two-component system CitB family sensor kinase|nr:sensor histidine kinase [Microbacteriaceae bacterium]
MRNKRRWSIATRVFAAQLVAVVALSALLTLVLWWDSRASAADNAARLSAAVSATLALDPFVIETVQGANPSEALQPYAVEVMGSADLDFITIMDTDGTRYTHRNPEEIGKPFVGTIEAALRGEPLTETFSGTLGPSVRAVVPVIDDGEVIAIVSAGVTVQNVLASLAPRIPFVVGSAAILVIIGSAGAIAGHRFLTGITGSMRPAEVTRMVSYYASVLHSIREGLILTDEHGQVVLYNDEAASLLGLVPASSDPRPVPLSELELPASLAELILSGRLAVEESHLVGNRVLVLNQEPASGPGESPARVVGTLTTLRDRTEVQLLAGELESVRTLSDALRSQTHEYANRLHTVVSLLELGRTPEAIELIAHEAETSQSLADDVLGMADEPALAALLLGKVAQAGERGIDLGLIIAEDLPRSSLSPSELVSVVGNLTDNAMDAAADGDSPRSVTVILTADPERERLALRVRDSGRGVQAHALQSIFTNGYSTKPADAVGRGYGLAVAQQILERRGGTIELQQGDQTEFFAQWPAAGGRS